MKKISCKGRGAVSCYAHYYGFLAFSSLLLITLFVASVLALWSAKNSPQSQSVASSLYLAFEETD